jgi:hypothetical protein
VPELEAGVAAYFKREADANANAAIGFFMSYQDPHRRWIFYHNGVD